MTIVSKSWNVNKETHEKYKKLRKLILGVGMECRKDQSTPAQVDEYRLEALLLHIQLFYPQNSLNEYVPEKDFTITVWHPLRWSNL